MITVACLIPTFFRPEGLKRVLRSLRETSPDVRAVVVAESDDEQAPLITSEFNATFVTCLQPRQGTVPNWNLALATEPNYDAYFLGADDLYFTPGWLEETLKILESIGGSGLIQISNFGHYLMTRDFIIEHHGGVMVVPHYKGWCPDIEAITRARRAGKFGYAPNAIVVHEWHGSASNNYAVEGWALLEQRRAAGWIDDFPPILKGEQQ